MRNTMEINSKNRDPYTSEQKLNTAIGVCMILIFAIGLVSQ